MPATVQAQYFGGSGTLPAGANAETGIVFNRADSQTGTTPVPIPSSAATNYSYAKQLQLVVTATSTTSINNRTVRLSAGLGAGIGLHWRTVTQAGYLNQTSANAGPPDTSGANSAASAPGSYTAVTTTAVQYDNTAQSTSSTGLGSALLLVVVLAVDNGYTGGPGSASLGNIILGYDEA